MSARRCSSLSSASAADEIRANEARLARHLGGQLGKALLGDRIAIDPDQRPGRTEPLRDQARVPATADGAVDRGLARPRIEQLDQLAGEHRDVGSGHVK